MDQPGSGYFDAAAGLPLHPVAAEAMQAAWADGWADPSRLTGAARRSAILLDAARQAAAEELDVRPDELSFLPSGVHALQHGLLGSLAGRRRAGTVLLHSAVEHSAVFAAADWHRVHGGEVEVAGVDGTGRVRISEFVELAGRPGVATAVLQAANHEVGTRQPVAEAAEQLAGLGVPLVVDAGHDLVYGRPPDEAPVFTADARLWGGPAGVGLLVVRHGTRWRPPFPTDESESGRSLGPPNVPAIVAAVAALRATRAGREAEGRRLAGLVDRIREQVPLAVPDTVVLGDPVDRLPNLVTFSCLYLDGEALLTELDRRGFAVSSGSSCTSDTLTPSHVLVAMGALTSGNVRISLHPGVGQADVERFLAVLPDAVAAVRAQAPGSPAVRETEGRTEAATVLDSRGRRCPLPVLDLARALPDLAIGAELTVLADDPAAAGDIAAWCRMRGQQLVGQQDAGDGGTAYRVRRVR
ncbi:cysteine desulfurase/sulfurtransferase TusA family protein [Jatrophihabitans sp.]|uniref:cysteine desulfurase/sulfurtransferase TusA family protein n=1 Tax=Jatrophihabitans sp. TaxID=1932789 RepID=UPI002CC8B729|nr:aminotransferase class V-fold PLP-dependent enzyme [Jatrophihabitans sp.]